MGADGYFGFADRVASDMELTNVEMELLPYGILSKAGIRGEVIWGIAERKADGNLITICAPEGRSPRAIRDTIVHELAHVKTDMEHTGRWRETYHHYQLKYGLVASSREVLLLGVGAIIAFAVAGVFLVSRCGKAFIPAHSNP